MSISELHSADVAVLGAGREGQAVLRWLGSRFPDKRLTVYSETPPPAEFLAMPESTRHTVVLGPLHAESLASHQVLVRSPGISIYRPELQHAQAQGVRVTSASTLWFESHGGRQTLCITGTKGKSTTAALTARLLEHAGASVELAGNIGRPLLDCGEADPDWWVVELSSYQLADLHARPSIAVILNLSEEHLDWHRGADNYFRDKLRLAVLCAGAPVVASHRCGRLRGAMELIPNVHWFDHPGGWQVSDGALLYQGEDPGLELPESLDSSHNRRNLAAALTAAACAGIDLSTRPDAIEEALRDFRGLPHRQQRLGVTDGLEWVDDSLATTPVATLAALDAFAGRQVTLLLGGMDRGLCWESAVKEMQAAPPYSVITLPDSGPRIAATMERLGLAPGGGIHRADDLEAAVRQARAVTPEGGVVLLSPGAPSFPHFRDFAARGAAFAALAGVGGATTQNGV